MVKVNLRLSNTPLRVFIIYPMLALGASIIPNMPGLPLTSYPTVGLFMLAAGLAMFKGCGRYMRNHGSGGPDPRTPATQLVTVGPYAYTRNPMYIGHLIWLSGLTIFSVAGGTWFDVVPRRSSAYEGADG